VCHSCCVPARDGARRRAAIITELDTTLSRQARIGSSGPGGLASEKNPINTGAMQVAEDLQNTLTTWARDIAGDRPEGPDVHPTRLAAWLLLMHIDAIRKHPAVEELHDEVIDAIRQARRVVDRPAERQFVGPCLAVHEGVTCTEDLYARPGATHVRCGVCGTEHDVAERRAWLLEQAADRLFTVREAAQMMGTVGHITVTEASIRGYIHRGRIGYRAGTTIRLGDLLQVVVDDSERRSA
jgi:LSD1 subclass zinc finger protein